MTREEAIEYIECGEISNRWGKKGEEVERMAIEALKAEPKLRQALELEKGAYNALVANVHCADCISRAEAIDACINGWNKDYTEILEDIRNLPAVSPQPNEGVKTGKWLKTPFLDKYLCFNCKREYDRREIENLRIDYCMSCGSKLEVEE